MIEPAERPVDDKELFLLRLRYKEGRQIAVGSYKPFLLDRADTVWVVYQGKVDVFAVAMAGRGPVGHGPDAGEPVGTRTHLLRLEAGEALFGFDFGQAAYGLLAVGHAETTLIRLPKRRLLALADDDSFRDEVIALLETWLRKLYAGLNRTLQPKEATVLHAGETVALAGGGACNAARSLIWVEPLAGAVRVVGEPALASEAVCLPLAPHAWLQASAGSELRCYTTDDYVQRDAEWASVEDFHRLALAWVRFNAAQFEEGETSRLEQKAGERQQEMGRSLQELASILNPTLAAAGVGQQVDALLNACQVVGQALNIPIRAPAGGASHSLNEIARASRVRVRRVALRGEWWRDDSGPLLAYLEEDERPVALLPPRPGKYELVDPATLARQPVTARTDAQVKPFAYSFYRPFPEREDLGAGDLVRFGLAGLGRDLGTVALMAAAIGLAGLLIPIGLGILIDTIIPGGSLNELWQLSLVLVIVAVATIFFQLTRSFALLRLQSRMNLTLQAALWDRLLRLPSSFFRGYSTGDLATRATGIQTIQEQLAQTALSSMFDSVAALFYLGYLFVLDARLGLIAFGLAAFAIGFTALIGYVSLKYQRQSVEIQGRISGMVLQFLLGLSKFRVAGAEHLVFHRWATAFTQQRQVDFKVRSLENNLLVFNATYPIFTSMTLFAAMAYILFTVDTLSTGQFLSFFTAFGLFLLAALQTTFTLIATLNIVPTYERLSPILRAAPETDEAKADPGEVRGEIEIQAVSFRYHADGPLVIEDLSLHIMPGEFVAVVGPSGAGKSTLLRFLLGFDQPESGTIYYDGKDLAGLDIQAVRQQIGTVLQNGQLMPGDIFNNIIGSRPLTLDDAWEAARLAGLEADIRAMPMGMNTFISEGGSTFSGGQRQRLLIARAVANKPRIVLFDEATSALDNRTQAVVTESLSRLRATRLVIAHRLSTIIDADRIVVLEKGRLVQEGDYQTLVRQPGPFATLARRQLI